MYYESAHNQNQQAELGKLSPFLKKYSKKPPSHPIRCGWRYTKLEYRVQVWVD